MLEQLEKVLGEMHVPAKEKLLWLVNNAGSLRWVSGRKKDFSSRIFLILKKEKFQHQCSIHSNMTYVLC